MRETLQRGSPIEFTTIAGDERERPLNAGLIRRNGAATRRWYKDLMGFPRAGFGGLVAASLLGAGVTLGVTAGLGGLSGSTTTVRELVSPSAQQSANASF